MYRATTPLQKFTFKDDPETFKDILITYSQGKTIVLEKEKSDLDFGMIVDGDTSRYTASFRLTQEEANLFSALPSKVVNVQVRVLTYDNLALASKVKNLYVEDVLDDKVMT